MDLQINLKKDLEYDEKYSYTIHKTKKIVEIQSFKDPSIGNIKVEFDPNEWSVNTSFDEIMNEDKSQKKDTTLSTRINRGMVKLHSSTSCYNI